MATRPCIRWVPTARRPENEAVYPVSGLGVDLYSDSPPHALVACTGINCYVCLSVKQSRNIVAAKVDTVIPAEALLSVAVVYCALSLK